VVKTIRSIWSVRYTASWFTASSRMDQSGHAASPSKVKRERPALTVSQVKLVLKAVDRSRYGRGIRLCGDNAGNKTTAR